LHGSLNNLLLIVIGELERNASIAFEVDCEAFAALPNDVRLDETLELLDGNLLHFGFGAADLGPAPFLDFGGDQLLLNDSHLLLAHLFALANVRSCKDAWLESVY